MTEIRSVHAVPCTIHCIGAAHWDHIYRVKDTVQMGRSNPVEALVKAGGVAQNVARHLVRFRHRVGLTTVCAKDSGPELAGLLANAGVICEFHEVEGTRPSYTAILDRDGNLVLGLADMDLYDCATLEGIPDVDRNKNEDPAACWVIDAVFPTPVLKGIIQRMHSQASQAGRTSQQGRAGKPIIALATSPAKARRFAPILDLLTGLICNEAEAWAILSSCSAVPADLPDSPVDAKTDSPVGSQVSATPDSAKANAQALFDCLVHPREGTEPVSELSLAPFVVISLGAEGAVLATADESIHARPQPVDVINVNGAGDAMAARFIHEWTERQDAATALDNAVQEGARYASGQDA